MLPLLLLFTVLLPYSYQQCLTQSDEVRRVSEKAAESLLQSERRFSADLLHTVTSIQPDQNVFFSPSSVYKALLLAYFISANNTESGLRKLLHLSSEEDKLDILGAYTLQNYYQKLQSIKSPNYQLTNANRLYYAKNLGVHHCMKVLFAEEICPAKFEYNHKVVKKVNYWVAEKTRNVIKDFLQIDQLSKDTQLVLVNAAYFKGSWKHQFDTDDTKLRNFHLSNGTVLKTPMMVQENEFKFREDTRLSAQIVELPYDGEDISMFIMVPLNPSPLATQNLVKKLNSQAILNTVKAMNITTPFSQFVTIPKFTLEKSLDLTTILETMGVGDLFQESADLSTLASYHRLGFSEAMHKAKIRVDEVGTEAAAATALISSRMGVESFVADHPFVYFLYDKAFDIILFFGVFNFPE